MIGSLSKSVLTEFFESYKSDFTNPEWRRMAKRAFGEAIVHHDDEAAANKGAGAVLETTRTKLHGWINSIQEREYVFGCDFCDLSDPLKPLSIGSVLFEPRLTWLEKMYDSGTYRKSHYRASQEPGRGDRLGKRRIRRIGFAKRKFSIPSESALLFAVSPLRLPERKRTPEGADSSQGCHSGDSPRMGATVVGPRCDGPCVRPRTAPSSEPCSAARWAFRSSDVTVLSPGRRLLDATGGVG